MSRCKEPSQVERDAALVVLFVFLGLPTLMVALGILSTVSPAVEAFLKGSP